MRKAGSREQKQVMGLEHERLTELIIGATIEIHRRLGPGFLESIYEKALIIESGKLGVGIKPQKEVAVA